MGNSAMKHMKLRDFPLPRFIHGITVSPGNHFVALYNRAPWHPFANPGVERAKKRKAWRESEFAAELDRTLAGPGVECWLPWWG